MYKIRIHIVLFVLLMPLMGFSQAEFSAEKSLDYCIRQAKGTLQSLPSVLPNLPRSVEKGRRVWTLVPYTDWTSGFWPGILWMNYAYTGDRQWLSAAEHYTHELDSLTYKPVYDHDIGFQLIGSYEQAYKLTEKTIYRDGLLRGAERLSKLFNPKVGTILSWPRAVSIYGAHNAIIDNMINLELLFWASRHGGPKRYYDIALRHALTTMKNQFRPDYTCYHVVLYDTVTGKKIKGITHQGYNDSSTWARGQAWAIYGFTMVYQQTKMPVFLHFVEKVTNAYLCRLPSDGIPYWDFDDPSIPSAPKDASAAAVTASALLELSKLETNKKKAIYYKKWALKMLQSLSSKAYKSDDMNFSFLMHSTGNKPIGGEIDASIIYADYYYEEALLRLMHVND